MPRFGPGYCKTAPDSYLEKVLPSELLFGAPPWRPQAMNEILFQYEKVNPTTWAYLASLLIVGLFFKFGRFWSVRNLDLLLLILLAPGLLLVSEGRKLHQEAQAAIAAARHTADAPESTGTATLSAMTDSPGDSPARADASVTGAGASVDTEGALADARKVNRKVHQEGVAAGGPVPGTVLSQSQEALRHGTTIERIGFLWLLATGLALLVRCLLDPTMVRRPLLEPNMTAGALTFSCCALFVFLMANVVASRPTADDLLGPVSAERLISRQATEDLDRHGPGYALVFMLPSLPTAKMGANLTRQRAEAPSVPIRNWTYRVAAGEPQVDMDAEFLELTSDDHIRLRTPGGSELAVPLENLSEADQAFVKKIRAYTTVAKLMAILSHLAIIVGIIAVGYWHFNDVKMGVGAATLYLMLPYTSQMTGRVDHVLPTAMLVWAVLCYRRPLLAGAFVGFAIGVIYYPLFLLPLWFSFYWQRGLFRFIAGLLAVLAVMVLLLVLVSPDAAAFWQCFKKMFGLMPPQMKYLGGIWALGWQPVYRYPILAAFVAMCGSMAIWPAQKNLGTLLSCSAAVMIATQFWHGYGGGLYMAWYLPLFLLTVFRPNLEDRVATSVVSEGWRA
ncbi:MAG: SHD1 domain-containing protein [Pirellulaceae bacterium]|nr:SHD1 domain-containing protein [Pirellulaceae bacterium]